jgi:hypothetical protein
MGELINAARARRNARAPGGNRRRYNAATPRLAQAIHAGTATTQPRRACLRPPAVGAGLAAPVTTQPGRACLSPPAVGSGLAAPVTTQPGRACLRPPAVGTCLAAPAKMERETGFEPATPSLEGWRSTAELFPPVAAEVEQSAGATRLGCSCLSPPAVKGGRPAQAPRASLRPPTVKSEHAAPDTMVGRGGFEPPKAYASRFTVCPLWPLGYLPEPAGMRPLARTTLKDLRTALPWRWREELNPRPTAYKAVALPLSYASTDKTSL